MSKRRNRRNQNHIDTSRNPIERIDNIGKHIKNRACGYQGALRKHLAELYGISEEIKAEFEYYQELIDCPCFDGRPRIREATADNFTQYTIEAVIRRAFHGSVVSDSCISKYIGAINYCATEGIRSTKAAAKMEEWGGVEKSYQRGKTPTKSKIKSPKIDNSASKSSANSKDSIVSASTQIFGSNHFHISLDKKALKSLLQGKKGERRVIDIVCKGRDEAGYLIWELIEDSRAPSYDNDDDDIETAA